MNPNTFAFAIFNFGIAIGLSIADKFIWSIFPIGVVLFTLLIYDKLFRPKNKR